jgi:D-alanine-D-alanine ligase-like ATP-grasp enzyme
LLAKGLKDVFFSKGQMPDVEAQLARAGAVFWTGIPADIRDNTLYAVDAVLDDNNKLWFLEMNSNPFVHPEAYTHMVTSVIDSPDIMKDMNKVSNLH